MKTKSNSLFSREKNPYGQKKSQQNRIKNIFNTMKKQDTEVKQEYAQKRYNDVVNSIKIGNYSKDQSIPIILISSKEDKNIENLAKKIQEQQKEKLSFINAYFRSGK